MVIERDGQRWEARLPGRQGRLLFAYLAVNRHRTCSRDELAGALWGEHGPAAGDVGLNAVLSKLRRALGPDVVQGRTSLFISERVFLPDDDTEWIEEHRDRLRDIRLRALAAQGNAAEALLVHAGLCRLLRDELGASPSPVTQAVHESLLRT